MLNVGIAAKPMSTYDPQAIVIIERVHQLLLNAFCTFKVAIRELHEKEPFRPFELFLMAMAYAIRSSLYTKLQATPGQLMSGRAMILPTQFKANWASKLGHYDQEKKKRRRDFLMNTM